MVISADSFFWMAAIIGVVSFVGLIITHGLLARIPVIGGLLSSDDADAVEAKNTFGFIYTLLAPVRWGIMISILAVPIMLVMELNEEEDRVSWLKTENGKVKNSSDSYIYKRDDVYGMARYLADYTPLAGYEALNVDISDDDVEAVIELLRQANGAHKLYINTLDRNLFHTVENYSRGVIYANDEDGSAKRAAEQKRFDYIDKHTFELGAGSLTLVEEHYRTFFSCDNIPPDDLKSPRLSFYVGWISEKPSAECYADQASAG